MSGYLQALSHARRAGRRGLEFGPLTHPLVARDEADVRYVDMATTEQLREKYRDDPNIGVDDIVEVDYAWLSGPLREVVGADTVFDFVIASHVIEHVPDPIWWLGEIHGVLREGGIVMLAVPDKRYIFDCQRPTSTGGDLVEAYLRSARKPSLQQLFDHHAYFAPVTPEQAWAREFDPAGVQRFNSDASSALSFCRASLESEHYYDSHCYVFTPGSFLDVVEMLTGIGLLPFIVQALYTTEYGDCQFFVVLERALHPGDSQSLARQLEAIRSARSAIAR